MVLKTSWWSSTGHVISSALVLADNNVPFPGDGGGASNIEVDHVAVLGGIDNHVVTSVGSTNDRGASVTSRDAEGIVSALSERSGVGGNIGSSQSRGSSGDWSSQDMGLKWRFEWVMHGANVRIVLKTSRLMWGKL